MLTLYSLISYNVNTRGHVIDGFWMFLVVIVYCCELWQPKGGTRHVPLKDKQAGKPPGTSESADVPDAQVWYL